MFIACQNDLAEIGWGQLYSVQQRVQRRGIELLVRHVGILPFVVRIERAAYALFALKPQADGM